MTEPTDATKSSELAALTDEELCARVAKERDPAAFSLLYERYAPDLFRIARRYCDEAAEDVVLDVMARFWEVARSFDPEKGPFRPWIRAVVRYASIRAWRREQQRDSTKAALEAVPEKDVPTWLPDGWPTSRGREELQKKVEEAYIDSTTLIESSLTPTFFRIHPHTR